MKLMYLNVDSRWPLVLISCQIWMGKTKGLYNAEFAAGVTVRIVGRDRLEEFKRNWRYHHPLDGEQLAYGGTETTVKEVAFYHGGDELYTLDGVPGTWHECCLEGRTGPNT
jgi:hypothetical protein